MMTREATENDLGLLMQGHFAFQALYAGHQLGVFTYLSGRPGTNRDDLACALRLAPRPAAFLLDSLRALGLIIGPDTGLRNAAVTERHLVDGRADSYGPILDWYQAMIYPAAAELTDSLRQNTNLGLRRLPGDGRTLYEKLATNPDLESTFHRGMSAISQIAVTGLIATGLLANCRRLLDVGGGDATNTIALARAYPQLTATVIDYPTVLTLAEDNITRAGLTGRIDLRPGNIHTDAFPADVDVALFAHVMPIFSPEENRALLQRAHRALHAGGSVVLYHTMRADTESGPLHAVLFSGYFLTLASDRGHYYTWSDYETWLAEAGFRSSRRISGLPFHHGLLTATT